ncbi:unnamed protein product [Boreogadus saida]
MDVLALLLVGLTASPWNSTHSLRWSSILTVIVEKSCNHTPADRLHVGLSLSRSENSGFVCWPSVDGQAQCALGRAASRWDTEKRRREGAEEGESRSGFCNQLHAAGMTATGLLAMIWLEVRAIQ